MSYQPPYNITPEIIRLISEISEKLGRLSATEETSNLRLRRINHIRTIQGSLAIEGNTLSEAQITAILEGKVVIAPPREIQEVRNATRAYDQLPRWQAESETDLLAAHQLLMVGLIDDIGCYRQGNVGVMKGERVIHMAPSAGRVRKLMADLFGWLSTTDAHPLIASSVFHYEFEFIHPFSDGNGRMGRLWQTLILSQWNGLLAQLPVENMVFQHQSDYYAAIGQSTQATDSAPFVEFILSMVDKTIDEHLKAQLPPQDKPHVTPQVKRLLAALFANAGAMKRDELQQAMGLKDRKSFRLVYLKPALEAQLIEMTIPDKPNSRLQQYVLTQHGRRSAKK
jgi:Fic family protein